MNGSGLILVTLPGAITIALATRIVLSLVIGRRAGRGQERRPLNRTRPEARGAVARYLYVPCVDASSGETHRWVQAVPVVKATAKRIYYTSETCDRGNAVVGPGCINREQFETDTRRDGRAREHRSGVRGPYRHGYPAGVIPVPGGLRPGLRGLFFYATREAAETELRREQCKRPGPDARHAPDITELRRAMVDAHPDRGGTADQFIRARRRYETARGRLPR